MIFERCLKVGNTKLVTQYNKEFFLQLNGLAMGVSDAPDLANISGYLEETKSPLLESPALIFYGRYIDDALALVYSESEEEALAMCKLVHIYDCTLEWSVSEWALPFLDMLIYKDDACNKLQHMPYRKARNSQERIPWITSHPISVRRGTFIGELSRMAVLSSTFSVYEEAARGIASLYISRGYPFDTVNGWLKKYSKEKWTKRLCVTRQEGGQSASDLLVLKSEYNLAWDYFSATGLGETMTRTWKNGIDASLSDTLFVPDSSDFNNEKYGWQISDSNAMSLFDCDSELLTRFRVTDGDGVAEMPDLSKLGFLNKRVIVSKKRTRNLYDLTSLWKKTVLSKMEENVLDMLVDDPTPDITEDVVTENTTEADNHPDRRWSPTRQLGEVDPNVFLQI
jgi:hypothetical protein